MRSGWLIALALVSCVPSIEDAPWLVSEPRLLAVRGDPAEAAPGASVSFTALVASRDGVAPALSWAFCSAPRAVAEPGVVSPRCLGEPSVLEETRSSSAAIPLQACAQFGSIAPAAEAGEPPRRPTDPDPTGGFYVPVRVATSAGAVLGFGLERLQCPLASAPADAAQTFADDYSANQHPRIEAVLAAGLPADGTTVSAGETIELTVQPSADSVETYAWYDPGARMVGEQTERLDVAWYCTAGDFEQARTDAANRWTAPNERGAVQLWVVLRDSRGGVDWRALTLQVE